MPVQPAPQTLSKNMDPDTISKSLEDIVKNLPTDQVMQVFTYASALSDLCLLHRKRE